MQVSPRFRGRGGQRRPGLLPLMVAAAAVWAVPAAAPAQGTADGETEGETSCVECHSKDDFMVTNPKLYQYFEQWRLSVHGQEEVTCSECHGGDPTAATKATAHQGHMDAASEDSPVGYRNVAETCGACHKRVYQSYLESAHHKNLQKAGREHESPTCVTCHGSVNTTVLNVNTVAKTCRNCHNVETDNHPDVPEKAERLLSQFLSIHRFYRFFTVKGREFYSWELFQKVGNETRDLAVQWHTLELEEVRHQTRELLEFLKITRNDIRNRLQQQDQQR